MKPLKLICIFLLLFLMGCDQSTLMEKMTPEEDKQVALNYINLLRDNKFDLIEQDLRADLKTPDIKNLLSKMASLFPPDEPMSVKVVGSHVYESSDSYQSNIKFEYEFPNQWLLANVAIEKKEGISKIIGFNVNPLNDSIENTNKFSFSGKSILQYCIFAFTIFVPLFIISVLILAIRTKITKRKWLWIFFILLGFGKLSINWATGQWGITPISFQLLGAGAFAPPYGAWTLSVSFPLGAIIFLIKRNKLMEIS